MIGDILFIRTSSPISWAIRKLCKSEWSHVVISCSYDNSWIIESDVLKKIKPRPNRYKQYEVVSFPLTDEKRLRLLQFFLKKTDVRYDYMQIIGIGLRLLGLTDREDLWNSANRMICSEIVDLGYKHIGFDLVPSVLDGNCTPADLASILLKKPVIDIGR